MSDLNSKVSEESCTSDEKTFIDLCWLSLDSFPLSSYKTYKNIQHIYLEGNKVKRLGDEFFPSFPVLKWLDIRNNEVSEIPKTVANHPTLQVLLLEGNKLEELPVELGSVKTLRGIQLARNPLYFPPKAVLAKGSSEVIQFLRQEWRNKEKTSKFSTSLQPCEIKSLKRKSPRNQSQKKKFSCNLRCQTYGKTAHQPTKPKKQSSILKDCVRVTKLVRPKPKTAVTILKDWTSVVGKKQQVPPDEIVDLDDETPTGKILSAGTDKTENQPNDGSGLLVKSKVLQDVWLRRIREVLIDQDSELQRARNKNSLSKWQNDAKDIQMKKWAEYVQGDEPELETPFGTDEEYKKMISRSDMNKKEKSSKFKKKTSKEITGEMVTSKITAILDVLQQLRKARSSCNMSPRAEQLNFSTEIKKITELQRTLSSLKAVNFNQSIKL